MLSSILRHFFAAVPAVIPLLVYFSGLLSALLFFFLSLGYSLMAGRGVGFDGPSEAGLSMLGLLLNSGWSVMMERGVASAGHLISAYYISFYILMSLTMVNLLTGLSIEFYNKHREGQSSEVFELPLAFTPTEDGREGENIAKVKKVLKVWRAGKESWRERIAPIEEAVEREELLHIRDTYRYDKHKFDDKQELFEGEEEEEDGGGEKGRSEAGGDATEGDEDVSATTFYRLRRLLK
mmetsp:Transcript_42892/g.110686  ORF Transcript_42892/g.110686 Transcript_42892/m.110686 type:complete len:237 (-) Transcript_42892:479-1189(-)